MGEIEPLYWNSPAADSSANVDAITAASDFHFAARPEKNDPTPRRRGTPKQPANAEEDAVVLSDIAEVSVREEEGMSVAAIAADLGLSAATVLTDIAVASAICHPPPAKD